MADYRDYQTTQRPDEMTNKYERTAGSGGGIGILLALGVILLFIVGIALFGSGSPSVSTTDPAAAPLEAPQAEPAPAQPAPAQPAPSQ